jgi:hypothetical protein
MKAGLKELPSAGLMAASRVETKADLMGYWSAVLMAVLWGAKKAVQMVPLLVDWRADLKDCWSADQMAAYSAETTAGLMEPSLVGSRAAL